MILLKARSRRFRSDRAMPYERVDDLPAPVRAHLPKHAQEIYRAAYNNAWEEYKSAKQRRGSVSREATAHRVAWAAVKEKYEKRNDRWVRKKSARP